MKKLLTHLQGSSTVPGVSAATTSSADSDKYMTNQREFKNWAQIASCTPQYYHEPTTLSQITDIILYATSQQQKVRVLGSGHSPANIAFCNDHLISLNKYAKIIGVDKDTNTIKVRTQRPSLAPLAS